MKILHFADLHLGVESYGRIDPTTGLSSRFGDFISALDQVVDYALKERVDLVLFCGDAYKSRSPSQTQQREFAKRISRLSSSGIPIFLLIGNHDLPNAIGRATTTEIFDTLTIKNVYVSSRPEIYKIATPGGIIQIASLPWLRRSALLAQLSKEEVGGLSFEQLNQRLEQVLTAIIAGHAENIDPSLPSILAAHVWVSGATLGSERAITIGQEQVLLPSTVANPAFDYVALGHIHRHQVLSQQPPVVYSGSLERLDFGEEGDDKGFYIVELEPNGEAGQRQTSFKFHQIRGRRFLTISLSLEPDDLAPTDTVLEAIAKNAAKISESIVRLQISLPAELEGQLSDGAIREALKEAHHITMAKEIVRQVRLRLSGHTAEEITPLDALKVYLEQKKYSQKHTKQLLEHGQKLIEGPGTGD